MHLPIFFFSQTDIINISKIQWIYCYFMEKVKKMTLRKNNSISHDLDKWFIIRKINILLWVCKTGKVHILHARNTLPFVVYIFFKHTKKVLLKPKNYTFWVQNGSIQTQTIKNKRFLRFLYEKLRLRPPIVEMLFIVIF